MDIILDKMFDETIDILKIMNAIRIIIAMAIRIVIKHNNSNNSNKVMEIIKY